jgi:hypothetical protein
MSAKKVNKIAKEIFIYVFLLFALLLISINIDNYLKPKQTKVLGTETKNEEEIFWQEFLTKNPNYVPGWIETGRIDKAHEIDPNYIKP